MPSRGQKFIEQFLKPYLNSERFGTRLMWLNKELAIFQVQWNHKSASGWTKDDAEVFMEWDKIKGRYVPDDKDRFTKSKQRFRAIMYKLIKAGHITEISCSEKFTKMYCFGPKENISNEAIVESTITRGNKYKIESSPEPMYNSDSGAYFGESQNYGKTNCEFSNIEDQKCANPISHLYVNIILENLSENQVTFSLMDNSCVQDANDCSENLSNCNVKLEDIGNDSLLSDCSENLSNSNVKLEDIGNITNEPSFEDSLFSFGGLLD